MTVGLFLGRFQPLHNGHLAALRASATQADKLYIGIGSANESGTEKNPFSADLREEMIRAVTQDLSNIEIVRIPDFPGQDDVWMQYVKQALPQLDVVFTGNEQTRKLFESYGYTVVGVEMVEEVSGTRIRELMKNGGDWHHLVPERVAAILV